MLGSPVRAGKLAPLGLDLRALPCSRRSASSMRLAAGAASWCQHIVLQAALNGVDRGASVDASSGLYQSCQLEVVLEQNGRLKGRAALVNGGHNCLHGLGKPYQSGLIASIGDATPCSDVSHLLRLLKHIVRRGITVCSVSCTQCEHQALQAAGSLVVAAVMQTAVRQHATGSRMCADTSPHCPS